jgi:hypothetical protein
MHKASSRYRGGETAGIVFQCNAAELASLEAQVDAYLAKLEIDEQHYKKIRYPDGVHLAYQTVFADDPTNTLTLNQRLDLGVVDELVELPPIQHPDRNTTVVTVSKKEIVLALMNPGRSTVFAGSACGTQALVDHVGIRQNMVAWTEVLAWNWPNGGAARWNRKYWSHGNLLPRQSVRVAINDAFVHQEKYAIGCYTATKLVTIQGTLDYYYRVKKDFETLAQLEALLLQDGGPLTHIEPGRMWSFEPDITANDLARPGKLITLLDKAPVHNFVPGDWNYFLNTDSTSNQKTGYEGSNAIYMGRGKFDDFYNDHHHYYTYHEKMNEVFQWRNRVFNARRDVAKVQPLAARDFAQLSMAPELGGIQLSLRAVPIVSVSNGLKEKGSWPSTILREKLSKK